MSYKQYSLDKDKTLEFLMEETAKQKIALRALMEMIDHLDKDNELDVLGSIQEKLRVEYKGQAEANARLIQKK